MAGTRVTPYPNDETDEGKNSHQASRRRDRAEPDTPEKLLCFSDLSQNLAEGAAAQFKSSVMRSRMIGVASTMT